MSDAQNLSGNRDKMGEIEKDGCMKKLTFTPPVLHKYGEVVKICQAATVQGQNDFFTS